MQNQRREGGAVFFAIVVRMATISPASVISGSIRGARTQ
jgi:hypothetical protein